MAAASSVRGVGRAAGPEARAGEAPTGRGGPPTLRARLLTLHVRVAMATAGLQQPPLNERG